MIYKGKVVKIVDFGAFVNFFGKRDGLVHVSQIENRRLNHPSDVFMIIQVFCVYTPTH